MVSVVKLLATVAALNGVAAGVVTKFPEGIFGSWHPKTNVTPQAILGPLAHDFISFTAQRDPNTTDVWWTVLSGQEFRQQGDQMQYCFGPYGFLVEQSPFSVYENNDNNITYCWREGLRGMPTQTKDCRGCDCAKITLNLVDADTLHFTFWMSPPVVHADATFVRSGKAPNMKKIESTMHNPYSQCTFKDHYGPNLPFEPDLKPNPPGPVCPQWVGDTPASGMCDKQHLFGACYADKDAFKPFSGMDTECLTVDNFTHYNCPQDAPHKCKFHLKPPTPKCGEGVLSQMKNDDAQVASLMESAPQQKANGICRQLNGMNFALDQGAKKSAKFTNVRDIRLQYKKPALPCDPCDVSYSVSAVIDEDEYIGFGFKGQSWEHKFPYPPEESKRPCYFGMCVDSYDNYTSDRIALGYTSGSQGCVREMVSKNVVGEPTDVDYKILKSTSIERSGGRTIMRFTVSQSWPNKSFSIMPDGEFRIMWAIGKVIGTPGCDSTLGYHGVDRGVSPLYWLDFLYFGQSPASSGCRYSPEEMGDSATSVMV